MTKPVSGEVGVLNFAWNVISALGGITFVLSGFVGVAYWLFRTFSERWLQSKFDARLTELQHSHNQELEKLRFRINAQFDRTTKLHEREYQILPELWEALASSYDEVLFFTSPYQEFPNIKNMNNDELEELLFHSNFYESQKQKIRNSEDREKTYQLELYWHRYNAVKNILRKFSRSMRFNGIFVPEEIKDKSISAVDIMWDALDEHEINQERNQPFEKKARERLNEEGKVLIGDVENAIQDRLWSIAKLD